MINVVGLTKYYGQNCAVNNLSFTAAKGEILGFLGPNGAGKTTTLRILTGYMPPTSGTVTIGGFDVIDQSLEVRKIVGYLPESVPLYQDMRVFDYLKFMGQLRKLDDLEDRVKHVLEQVDMTERSRSYISKLSKGMRQRVGLAQALIHEPDVLILDEPTIGLDPTQIIEIRKLIQEIGKEKTVMLSTHILSEAQQICDRVLIINRGQLVAEDTPEHLQQKLSGKQKVTVQLAGDPEPALAVLSALPEISSSAINERGLIILESTGKEDIRPKVISSLSAAQQEILEIYSESANLEDIFLQLIRDEEFSAATPTEASDSDLEEDESATKENLETIASDSTDSTLEDTPEGKIDDNLGGN